MSGLNNIEYAKYFQNNVEDPALRSQMVKDKPELENTVAFYVKEEKKYAKDGELSPTDKLALQSMAGILAYHIKEHGVDHYGPEAKNELLAESFTKTMKPEIRDQAEPTTEELAAREQLIKDNPALATPLNRYEAIESLLSTPTKTNPKIGLDKDDVEVLKHSIVNISGFIRLNEYAASIEESKHVAAEAVLEH